MSTEKNLDPAAAANEILQQNGLGSADHQIEESREPDGGSEDQKARNELFETDLPKAKDKAESPESDRLTIIKDELNKGADEWTGLEKRVLKWPSSTAHYYWRPKIRLVMEVG